MSTPPPITLSAEQWAARVCDASKILLALLPAFQVVIKDDPGVAALVGLLLARSVCCSATGIPSFAWYCARVAELPGPEPMSTPPPIGNDAEQAARARHAVDAHGWRFVECAGCAGEGCAKCDGVGCFMAPGTSDPCGPACPFLDLKGN
jgi:hypothetical protein